MARGGGEGEAIGQRGAVQVPRSCDLLWPGNRARKVWDIYGFVFIAKNAPRRLPVRPALPIMRASFGQLAQLVEQRIENPRVRGSIPRLATKI